MTAHRGAPVTREAMNRLRCNRETALRLPEPGDDWALSETDMEDKDFYLVRELGLISSIGDERVRVAAERDHGGGNYIRKRWTTDPDAYRWIQDNLGDVTECPAEGCHATGITNPKGVDGYRCTNDECDEELTEAQARELIQ